MGSPIFNIVREGDIESTKQDIPLDYITSTDQMQRHDEVRLVDGNGFGAAFPSLPSVRDLDLKYNLLNTNRERSPRGMHHDINFAIDWVPNDAREKLNRFMMERARVRVSPGFGSHSLWALRPLVGTTNTFYRDGTTALRDLTGRHLAYSTDPDALSVWDRRIAGGMLAAGAGPGRPCTLPTPWGAGLVSQRPYENFMVPSSPESATSGYGAGKAGWAKWGADASEITFALNTNGFGHTKFPHSLRVTTDGTTSSARAIGIQGMWDPASGDFQGNTMAGSGNFLFGVWMRGRFAGNDVRLTLSQTTHGTVDEIDMSGLYFEDWTPFWLEYYDDWTGEIPSVSLKLEADTVADRADIEIGPCVAIQESGKWFPKELMIANSTSGVVGDGEMAVLGVKYARSGTQFVSFEIPQSLIDSKKAKLGLIGSDTGFDIMYVVDNGSHQIWLDWGGIFIATLPSAPRAGAHSLAFVWASNLKKLYFDGVLIDTYSGTGHSMQLTTSGTWAFGSTEFGGIGCAPIRMLSTRQERDMWDDTRMLGEHLAATDEAATALIAAARGRTYEIVDVPRTPRTTARGTHWLGNLKLRQVEYSHNLADITTQEVES